MSLRAHRHVTTSDQGQELSGKELQDYPTSRGLLLHSVSVCACSFNIKIFLCMVYGTPMVTFSYNEVNVAHEFFVLYRLGYCR